MKTNTDCAPKLISDYDVTAWPPEVCSVECEDGRPEAIAKFRPAASVAFAILEPLKFTDAIAEFPGTCRNPRLSQLEALLYALQASTRCKSDDPVVREAITKVCQATMSPSPSGNDSF